MSWGLNLARCSPYSRGQQTPSVNSQRPENNILGFRCHVVSVSTTQPALVAQKQPETTYKWCDRVPTELYLHKQTGGEMNLAQTL